MRYYDLKRHWTKKIIPHLDDKELNRILRRDFNQYTQGRWDRPFFPDEFPEDIESCDWRFDHRGPWPRYWRYVKHGACHWIANFSLRLAMLVEPKREWRIVTHDSHSTVWDGKETLFDFNYYTFGVEADEAFRLANQGEVLKIGEYMDAGYP